MERRKLVGTKEDGVELRYTQYDDGTEELDEVVVYKGGKVLYHGENMDSKTRSFQIYAGDHIVHGSSYAESGELISKIEEILADPDANDA